MPEIVHTCGQLTLDEVRTAHGTGSLSCRGRWEERAPQTLRQRQWIEDYTSELILETRENGESS